MIFFIIAGLWALLRGRMTIAPKVVLIGRQARVYGVVLLLYAFLLIWPVSLALRTIFPAAASDTSSGLWSFINVVVFLAVAFGTALICRKIKLPTVDKSKEC